MNFDTNNPNDDGQIEKNQYLCTEIYIHDDITNIIVSMKPSYLQNLIKSAGLLAVCLSPSTINLHAQGLVINEVMVANTDQFVDPSYNYGAWLELYNPTATAVTLSGWYISDDLANLTKYKIHKTRTVSGNGGFLTLWCGRYTPYYSPDMIDLDLDEDGGTIYLSNASGVLQASADYPAAISRCSWARTTDGGSEWSYAFTPTPAASNKTSTFSMEQLEAPVVDQPSQIYSGTLKVNVEVPEGCTLKYVLNGAAPDASNGITSNGSISMTNVTRIYRFRLFKDGCLPSPVVTRSYLYSDNKTFSLPVISIVSANDNFYGDKLGIFVKGTNGRPGAGQSSACNWNMDWERPSNFEYITADGQCVINQEVDVERCGGWSRAWTPYSFKIKANKEYDGLKSLDYAFFSSKPHVKTKSLQIRNGGNDNGCRILDPGIQEIVRRSGLYINTQAYQPVVHYVNGTYKGTINMRQTNNKDYAWAEYGYDSDELDQFEMSPDSGYVQVRGTKESWNKLIELSRYCSNASSYAEICNMLDIDGYINYMAVLLYIGNTDWPQNNVKGFKSTLEDGKFRFVVFDTDHAFKTNDPFNTFANKQNYTFDSRYGYDNDGNYIGGKRLSGEIEFVTLFLNLLNNSTFRKQFIDSFCLVAGSVFSPDRCKEIINELCDAVSPMQSYDGSSPWNTATSMINNLSSWRQSEMVNKMKSYSKFNISGLTAQTVNMEANVAEAHLLVNGLPVPTDKFSGQLFRPAVLEAQAPAGYRFVGWKSRSASSTTVLASDATWKYYDKGSLEGTAWKSSTYSDSGWKSGKAPLGYYTGGTRNYNTTISYGSDASNKYPTYYFRTTLNLASTPKSADSFTLNYTCDDGFVLYVNGTEAARYNMPSGTPAYKSFSTTYASGNPDTGTATLKASLFRQGANTIAVEVHNNNASSTDIYWSGSIALVSTDGGNVLCSTPKYTLPQGGTHNLLACFEVIPTAERTGAASHPVVINEVSASNNVYCDENFKKNDWIELYNTTDKDIDLSGMYLTDNLKKPQKWQIAADTEQTSTVIAAHSYKLIWCDKKTGVTQLHAPFKLGNDDNSELMLTAADGSWSDTLNYCAHTSTESVGRYPDGGDSLYVFLRSTADAANVLTTSAEHYTQPYIEYISDLQSETLADVPRHYTVYDMSGRQVDEGEGQVVISHLPGGAYIVRRGNTSSKIIR